MGFSEVSRVGANSSYDWMVFGVFRRDTDGKLFYGSNYGASCSYPFEGAAARGELVPLTDMASFIVAARKWARSAYGQATANVEAVNKLLLRVADELDGTQAALEAKAQLMVKNAQAQLTALTTKQTALTQQVLAARKTLSDAQAELRKINDR